MVLSRGKEKTLESIREARGAPEEGRARAMASEEYRRGSGGGGGASSVPLELLTRCSIEDRKQDERIPLPVERKLEERKLEERKLDERKQSSAAASSGRKIVIKSADMKESMQKDAIACALAAFENRGVEKDIAEYIKKEFDKNHGPTWHCIVGRNFGSYVTHETNHFIYFYLDQKAILLFKSG